MKLNSTTLRADIIQKRVILEGKSLEECSTEIGISKATLSRLENMKMPDLITYFKVCKWLKKDPKTYIK